jgi:membrane protease YdiL (CAAX protease family)
METLLSDNCAEIKAVKSDSPPSWTPASSFLIGLVGLACFIVTLFVVLNIGQNICSICWLSKAELIALQVIVECLSAAGAGWMTVKLIRLRAQEGFWRSIQWHPSASQIVISGTLGLCASVVMRFALTRRFVVPLNGIEVNRLFLLVFIGTVILQPLIEEVYFRGILFCGLSSRFSPVASMAIVTLIFVALHARHQWIVLPIAILVGAVRVITRSTCNSFAMHLAYNLGVVLWGIR